MKDVELAQQASKVAFMFSTRLLVTWYFVWSLGISIATAAPPDKRGAENQWARWRGPLGTGEAIKAKPPVTWSETENVRWKTPLPGRGHSTPVVWGKRVFVTSAEPFGEAFAPLPDTAPGAHDNLRIRQKHRFWVICLDRPSGKVLWKKNVHEAIPHAGGHYTGSLASMSPVCDAQHVIASFGSYGIYCMTHEGQLVWSKQLGKMQTKHGHGEGSSPELHGDTVIINWDHEAQSFLLALKKQDGSQLWKRDRREVTSWSSPLVMGNENPPQVVVAGTERVRSYAIKTGDVLWEFGGLSNNVVSSPVAKDGMVYVGSSYDTRAIIGVEFRGAKGDITKTERVKWSRRQRPPYVPSLLLYQDTLYYLRHYQGILTRLEAKSGEEPTGPFRLEGMREIYASPVAADGRIYVTERFGATLVLQHGLLPRPLAVNRLNDTFNASAAIVGTQLLLRGEKALYCLEDLDNDREPNGGSPSAAPSSPTENSPKKREDAP